MVKQPKRTNLKGPGVCIFCGRTAGTVEDGITISMSKQHLWPKWMQKPFPQTHTHHSNNQVRTRFYSDHAAVQRSFQPYQGDIKTKQMRIVCKYHCNNGWISDVEDSTKEFLIPLIKGEFFSLLVEHQHKFALWLAIVSTIWEFTDPHSQAIPPGDREHIFSKRRPPPHWSMWIGHYQGTMLKTWYRHHGNYAATPDSPLPANFISSHPPNLQISSLQIGELFMHVASSSVPSVWQFDHGFSFPGLSRIWPNGGHPIQWPSLTTLSDSTALVIADRTLARMKPLDS